MADSPGTGAAASWKRLDVLHHDAQAEHYDDLIGREFAPYQHLHTARPWARLLAAVGARVVLDVGGGTGRTALTIADAGPAVVVLDMSRGMLGRARANATPAQLARLHLLVGDAERLPFPDECFDALVCQGVLHHLPSVHEAMGEADRVLRCGGWLCIAEPDEKGSRLARAVLRVVHVLRPVGGQFSARRSPAAKHERALPARSIAALLRTAGYSVSTQYLVHPPIVYRFMPEAVAMWSARLLNRDPPSRSHGDMVVMQALKHQRNSFLGLPPVR